MFTRARIFLAFAFFWICSNAMAVTGATTFVVGSDTDDYGAAEGFSLDGCYDTPDFGSVATPVLSDGKKICAVTEVDLYPIADNTLYFTIDGFTSDPGSNYFNTLSLYCGFSLPSGYGYYYYTPATASSSGQASWSFDLSSTSCIYGSVGSTFSLSID